MADYSFRADERIGVRVTGALRTDPASVQQTYIIFKNITTPAYPGLPGPTVVIDTVDNSTKGFLGREAPFSASLPWNQPIPFHVDVYNTFSANVRSRFASMMRANLIEVFVDVAGTLIQVDPVQFVSGTLPTTP